jgi:gliding motility-associated-like protein
MLAFISLGQILQAQIIDKVCPSMPYGNYGTKGSATSIFIWNIQGGQIIQSNGKDSITVEWDFLQPKFLLSVVEISASGCIGDTINAEVAKGNDPAVFVSGNDSICVGNSTLLSAYGGMDYIWSTQQTQPTISLNIFIDTTLFVIGNDGCGFDTAFYSIKALPLPEASFTHSPHDIIEFENIIFTYDGNGGTHFQWYFDDNPHKEDQFEVTHSFYGSGNHKVFLYVENEFKCSDTISRNLLVQKNRTNSFTPDNDGVNDYWELDELKDYPNCRVWIFDRSGAEVFYSVGYNSPWDGTRNNKPLPVGSYYYIIDFGVNDYTLKGVINILR